jgi:C4-dicarboxylate-specific signal transduction histidine kinase
MIFMWSTRRLPKAIDGAASAYLAKCAQIADPEVADLDNWARPVSLTAQQAKILTAQQAKIPHEKSKGLRAGSSPSKRGLIIWGMLTSPDSPSGGLVLRSEDARESIMSDIRHHGPAPNDIEKNLDATPARTHAPTPGSEALREAHVNLAHLDRNTTTGRLTASIAPEVTQSIATIVTNAQAAQNFLDHQPPNLDEVRQALNCIVRDAYRASDVIYRIRGLFKEAPPKKERVEVNGVIRDVLELTRGEATKNGVSVLTRFAEPSLAVQADRVQLQQVILNLIINAVEAMSGMREGARELLICTENAVTNAALVAVRDSGPGLDPRSVDRLFEAFSTTKIHGMGIGLAICRSIIEAHGGQMWAGANEPRGAVFQFTVPLERDETVAAG